MFLVPDYADKFSGVHKNVEGGAPISRTQLASVDVVR